MTINSPKALFAGLLIICLTVLMAIDSITSEAGVGLLTLVVGYVLGNGVQAASNRADVPGILRPKPGGRRADDT